MTKDIQLNDARILGTVIGFEYSHSFGSRDFNYVLVETERLSGYKDIVPVIVEASNELQVGSDYLFIGDIRSRRTPVTEDHKRLDIFILASEVYPIPYAMHDNTIELVATITEIRQLRTRKSDKYNGHIIDLMITAKTKSGKKIYIPCIAWDKVARIISHKKLSDTIHIKGRLQSRDYEKDGNTYTALELSIYKLLKDNIEV